MNVFAYELAADEVAPAPAKSPTKFVVDDNVGESVHVHRRNVRLEFAVRDFDRFATHVAGARRRLDGGNRRD